MDTGRHILHDSLLLFLLTFTVIHGSDQENRLVSSLLTNYSSNVRPVRSSSESVQVVISMALNQIIDLNEKFQSITSKIWLRLYWNDQSLRWDPDDFAGITSCRLRVDEVWRPDIELYEKTSCGLNVDLFPWDDQICTFKFGSWTYSMDQLDIRNATSSSDLSTYIVNGEWDLHTLTEIRHEVVYSIGGAAYSDVTFYLIIRRKPLYYIFNLILPCVFVKLTALLAFVLPPESGEKVSLGVTVLLALTVFLLLVADTLPPLSDSIPLMAQYFGATIILLAASTSLSVVVINIHHRGSLGVPVPRWMRRLFFDVFARMLCMRKFVEDGILLQDSNHPLREDVPGPAMDGPHNTVSATTVIKNSTTDAAAKSNLQDSIPAFPDTGANTSISRVESYLEQIVSIINGFQETERQKTAEKRTHSEWVILAYILDRILLILFLIAGILVALLIFYQKYFIDNDIALKYENEQIRLA